MASLLHPMGAMCASQCRPNAARRQCVLPRLAVKPLGFKQAIGCSPLLGRRPALAPRNAFQQHAVCSAAPLEVRRRGDSGS
jgi:hypothetical protein